MKTDMVISMYSRSHSDSGRALITGKRLMLVVPSARALFSVKGSKSFTSYTVDSLITHNSDNSNSLIPHNFWVYQIIILHRDRSLITHTLGCLH